MTTSIKRKIIVGSLLAVGIMLALIYFAVNPEDSRFMPRCTFKILTGYDCPGCGSQRMIHALLHGDIPAAWRFNPFLLCMIPVILLYVWLDFYPAKNPRLFRFFHSPAMIYSLGASIIIWGITRNI